MCTYSDYFMSPNNVGISVVGVAGPWLSGRPDRPASLIDMKRCTLQ